MADTPIRFIVVRVTGATNPKSETGFYDPDHAALVAHDAIVKALGRCREAQLVDMSTTGRDPQPPVPEESEGHVDTLRKAGHHGPASHLEKVAALHARETAEHLAARTILVQSAPHGVCAPTAPTTAHAAFHAHETTASREAAIDVHEHWVALRNLAHVAKQDPDSIDAATVLRAYRDADRRRDERIAKRESNARLVAEREAQMAADAERARAS